MPIPIIIAGIFILVGAFSYSILNTTNSDDNTIALDTRDTVTRELMPNQVNAMPMGDMGMMMFADGTYTKAVQYEVPYGYIEPMEVSLTFKEGIVTDADVSFEVENPVSADYQNAFESYYKDEVVGQLVEAVSLARMGGASLTNNAFDAALENIKAESVGQATSETGVIPFDPVSLSPEAASINDDREYADGTYMVENTYHVMPGFREPMQTTITLTNGIITETKVAFASSDPHSLKHQSDFALVYKKEVIGTPISEASFARIGNASLTTNGFNDALKGIRQQASKQSS